MALLFQALPARAETSIMVATDLHYLDASLYENRELLVANLANGDGKTTHFSDVWLAALVDEAIARAPDALVLAGDQTFNGAVLSHRSVSGALDKVQAAGVPVYVIPGNHDINNDRAASFTASGVQPVHSIPLSRHDKYYHRFGLQQAFSRDPSSMSYAVEVGEGLWLIMLDAGIYEPYAEIFGLITAETQAWLETVLAEAQAARVQVMTVTHQSMLPHSDHITAGYSIVNWESISDILISHGVRLNLSGHIHIQHIAQKETLFDVATSALSSYPNQFGLVILGDDGSIRYDTHTLSEAYLPDGLLEEAAAFHYDASYAKALLSLRDVDAPPAEKARMAAFAAEVNRHYYAGRGAEIRDQALADDTFQRWLTGQGDIFWGSYLQSMLGEQRDMNHLYIPAAVE